MTPDWRRSVLGACLLAVAGGSALPSSGVAAASPAAFVNELHYDNVGADIDEGVEIAGPAGTDLAGWTVVAYNGLDGVGYATTPLSGVVADQESGFGTLFFPQALQNGSPDGIALVDANGDVAQTLGYESAFAATQGVASGLTFGDIGQFERPSTPIGRSLQLGGRGTLSTDFRWGYPAASSLGMSTTARRSRCRCARGARLRAGSRRRPCRRGRRHASTSARPRERARAGGRSSCASPTTAVRRCSAARFASAACVPLR